MAAVVGAVLLVLVTVVAVVLIRGGGSDDSEDGAGAQQEEQDQGQDDTDRDPGSPGGASLDGATDGRMVFKADEYTCGAEIPDRSSPSEAGMYCVFDMHVENTSNGDIQLNHEWQRLKSTNGDFHRPAKPSVEEEADSLWQEIPAGDEARGSLVFLVPDDTDPEELVMHSREGGDSARVDLSDVPRRD